MPVVYEKGALVKTPFGVGRVVKPGSRSIGGTEVVPATLSLINWSLSSNVHPLLHTHNPQWPVIPPEITIDCDVLVPSFGRGRLISIDNETGICKVLIRAWRLSNFQRVYGYFNRVCVRFLKKKSFLEMDALEKIDLANEKKVKAQALFLLKKFSDSAILYKDALEDVNSITHDASNTNDTRASLLEVMISVFNNMSNCYLQIGKNAEAVQAASNAIMLLDAVANKPTGKLFAAMINMPGMNKHKFMVEWRVKSLLFSAQSNEKLGNYDLAVENLKRCMILCHGDEAMGAQDRKVRKLLHLCVTKSVEIKNNKKKIAQKMFNGGSKKKAVGKKAQVDGAKKKTLPTIDDDEYEDIIEETEVTPEYEYEGEPPWYAEHQELLILAGIAGAIAGFGMLLAKGMQGR